MKPIDTSNISPPPRIETDRQTNNRTNHSGPIPTNTQNRFLSDDTVELTDTANKLHRLSQEVLNAPGVDVKQVEIIRQRIAEGSYKIDAARIADELISQEDELA